MTKIIFCGSKTRGQIQETSEFCRLGVWISQENPFEPYAPVNGHCDTLPKVKCDLYLKCGDLAAFFLSAINHTKSKYNSDEKRAMKPIVENAFMEKMLEAIVSFPAFAMP